MIVFTVNLEYGFFMNNSKIITSQVASNLPSDFFKSLEDKYLNKSQNTQNPKSKAKKCTNKLNKSMTKSIHKKSQEKEKKKCKGRSREQIFVDIQNREDQEQLRNALTQYDVMVIEDKKQSLFENVVNSVRNKECMRMNIEIQNLSEEEGKMTKTNALRQYCQNLIKTLNKAAVSIYSRASSCGENISLSNLTHNSFLNSTFNNQVYDMLSIRKQVKQDPKSLVKTNITSNAKSHLIVKKLIDFANERQLMMEKQFLINEVVVRIMPHKNIENQQNEPAKQFQPFIEIRVKDPCSCAKKGCQCQNTSGIGSFSQDFLMEGMKINMKVYKIGKEQSIEQILSRLKDFKKSPREQTEEQLVEKIKMLQAQLINNKKELQRYKGKVKWMKTEGEEVESERLEEDDPNDLVLPSERVNVNMCFYNRISLIGSKKGSQQEDIFDSIK